MRITVYTEDAPKASQPGRIFPLEVPGDSNSALFFQLNVGCYPVFSDDVIELPDGSMFKLELSRPRGQWERNFVPYLQGKVS